MIPTHLQAAALLKKKNIFTNMADAVQYAREFYEALHISYIIAHTVYSQWHTAQVNMRLIIPLIIIIYSININIYINWILPFFCRHMSGNTSSPTIDQRCDQAELALDVGALPLEECPDTLSLQDQNRDKIHRILNSLLTRMNADLNQANAMFGDARDEICKLCYESIILPGTYVVLLTEIIDSFSKDHPEVLDDEDEDGYASSVYCEEERDIETD
jgi:hypothetical protein